MAARIESTPIDDARDTRRATFLAVARSAFFEHGYGATSMSAIAATLGGSKTTLWAHFRSKDALFAAVVDDVLARHCRTLGTSLPPDVPVLATLERFGAVLMATILSTPMIELHRLIVGEAGRFPELAARYHACGPLCGIRHLADYFAAAMDGGRLRVGNPEAAAIQFVALCQSGSFQQAILGIGATPGADSIARDVARAVDAWRATWGRD